MTTTGPTQARPGDHGDGGALALLLRGGPDRPETVGTRVFGLLLLLGAPLVVLGRLSGATALTSLWAEDGTLFLADALRMPARESALRAYAGYLHLPGRLIAELATQVPIGSAAAAMTGLAAVVAGLVGWWVFRVSRHHVASPVVRALLGTAVVVLPTGGGEVLANVSNLHWFLLYGAVWTVVSPAHTAADAAVGAAVVFAAATSDPMAGLLAPLALARLVVWPRWCREHLVTLAFAAGGALQALVVVGAPRTPPSSADDALAVLEVAGARVVASGTVGETTTKALLEHLGWWPVALITVVVVAGMAAMAPRRPPAAGALAGVLLVAGAAFFAVPMAMRWHDSMVPGLGPPAGLGLGGRYFVVPQLCLLAALLCLLEPWVVARRGGWRTAAATLALVPALGWAVDFRAPHGRNDGHPWGLAVEQAAPACDGAGEVAVPISPPGWTVNVPCSVLSEDGTRGR